MKEKEFNTSFPNITCKKCQEEIEPVTDGSINETHGYKLFCPLCNVFIGWGGKKKPVKNENGERISSSQWSANRLNITICEICHRERYMLGPDTLEVHHKLSVDEGGTDEPENIIIVCTACHKLIHFLQCYFNRHLLKYYEGQNE